MASYSEIKTLNGTSTLFGRHFVLPSSFNLIARSLKLRMSEPIFQAQDHVNRPQRGHFLPRIVFRRIQYEVTKIIILGGKSDFRGCSVVVVEVIIWL